MLIAWAHQQMAADARIPIILAFTEGNILLPDDVDGAPDWFDQADFILTFSDEGHVEMVWTDDHWEVAEGVFPSADGTAILSQGIRTIPAEYSGAEI